MIRLPGEVAATNSSTSLSTREKQVLHVKENVALGKLARALLKGKMPGALVEGEVPPEISSLRSDVRTALEEWLRDMLVGPALPFNKETNFVEDCLASTDLVADADIYLESLLGGGADHRLPRHRGCDYLISTGKDFTERNRADATKARAYPDPRSPLRVREERLRERCAGMVAHFASAQGVTNDALQKKATEEFYHFYHETIMVHRPLSYNSYTGMAACLGDGTFLRTSEDIVNFCFGLTTERPKAMSLTSAPPPVHTVLVYLSAMALCLWNLPSLSSIDERATLDTFTTSVKGGPVSLSPLALGIARWLFACACLATTVAKTRNGGEFQIVRLPGSRLRGGRVSMRGWRSQGYYTSWGWNLLGLSFFLGGAIPLLAASVGAPVVARRPWLLRSALISFEVAAPSALLTSSVVTYALWPQAYKEHGPAGTEGFRSWIALAQHNGNSAMVLLEVTMLGGLPAVAAHAAFAPLFMGIYQLFMWAMANHWSPRHGPVYPYFFADTTLGYRTTLFMVALLAIMGFFFQLFALLDRGAVMMEHLEFDLGALPNIGCLLVLSYMLMKFKD